MTPTTNETFDPTRAALLVRYGSTSQRFRFLDSDLILLGRNRACHVGLSGPDIAEIHCILNRGPTGWRIRDGGSRIGTRLNGQAIKDEPLADGDVIQVGSFLFEMHLPPEHGVDPAASPERQRHLRRSRRRFCRLALLYRRRLRAQPAQHQDGHAAEAQRLVEMYNERLREFDQRAQRLEQEERKLVLDRDQLEREADVLLARADEMEADLLRLKSENEKLRSTSVPPPSAAGDSEELRGLHDELTSLREKTKALEHDIEERDFLIEELRQRSGTYPVGKLADIEACEAELIGLRRELDEERQVLEEERDQLKMRAVEMDETMRAMELELSLERARWARERAELDRVREEIRQERERHKRQAGTMERLASLHRLKNGHT